MPSRRLLLIAAASLQITLQCVHADTIILKDGETYTGKIIEQSLEESLEGTVSLQVEGQTRMYHRVYVIEQANGTRVRFTSPQVQDVQFSETPVPHATHLALTFQDALIDGRIAADSRDASGWFLGGYLCGVGGGLIGTGIVWALASGSGSDVRDTEAVLIRDRGTRYTRGYIEGHRERMRSERKANGVAGGLLGTLTSVVMYVNWVAN